MARKVLMAVDADAAELQLLDGMVARTGAWQLARPAGPGSPRDATLLFVRTLDAAALRGVADLAGSRVAVALADPGREAVVRLMKAGAADVLSLPLVESEVAATLATAEGESTGNRQWAVFGAAGGCGVTTLAVNLADQLARGGAGTALVDLGVELGCASQFLDLKPRFTVADVARNADRLDAAYLGGTLCTDASGLRVLPAPLRIEEADELTPPRLRRILDELRALHRHTVLDLPRGLDERTVLALDRADAILLLVPLDVPGLFVARRLRETFGRLGYPQEKLRFVVARKGRRGDVAGDDAQTVLGAKPFHVLPEDDHAARTAMNLGRPLSEAAPRSALTAAMQQLAAKLREAAPGEPRLRRRRSLLDLFRRQEA